MEKEKLCPGCMRELNDIDKISVCPHCGYDLKNMQVKPYQLRPYTMLGEQEKRYVVGRVVGEGAFGLTYVAFDQKLEMKVAIKEFYPRSYARRNGNAVELQPQQGFDIAAMREEMISEARNLAKLDQLEGVVEVKDYFRDNNTIYIVMEYIDGVNLKDYLARNGGRFQVAMAKKMMRPVIESLMKVHDAGMIHRDISPDNIMVTPDGRMKLIDFGTAKESDDTDALALGKKGYAPPEQFAKGGRQGTWTDVYALAATYYYCIVGKKPPVSVERLKGDTLAAPSQAGVIINPIEEEALLMALSPDVDTRFKDTKALYNAFYNQITGTQPPVNQRPPVIHQPPVDPKPPVIQPQEAPPSGQNKMMVVIAAAAAVVVIAAAAIGIRFIAGKGQKAPASRDTIAESDSRASSEEAQTAAGKSPNADLLEEWQAGINKENYGEVIDSIIQREGQLEADEKEEAGKLLARALDKEQKAFIMEVNTRVGSEDYAGALDFLTESIEYTKELADSDFAKKYADTSGLEEKYEAVYSSYKSFLMNDGMIYASGHDEESINEMFQTADRYFEGEEYERLKVKVYTELVYSNIGRLTGSGTPEEAVSYISSHVEMTDYNCWVIEFLDFFRSQMNLPGMSDKVSHVSGEGYILPDSAAMYLSGTDLSALTQYELYLAYFEIYARHGRKFNDPSVEKYFSRYQWYTPSVEPNAFDETSLNEYEKANAEAIFKYQREKGYR